MTPPIPAVVTVVGGYHVTLHDRVHVVNKQRRCSCGRPACAAIRAVAAYLQAGGQRAPAVTTLPLATTLLCPICRSPARGTLERKDWMCSADRSHFFFWRVQRIRQARAKAMQSASAYALEVLSAFASEQARAEFLSTHALTYPASA